MILHNIKKLCFLFPTFLLFFFFFSFVFSSLKCHVLLQKKNFCFQNKRNKVNLRIPKMKKAVNLLDIFGSGCLGAK